MRVQERTRMGSLRSRPSRPTWRKACVDTTPSARDGQHALPTPERGGACRTESPGGHFDRPAASPRPPCFDPGEPNKARSLSWMCRAIQKWPELSGTLSGAASLLAAVSPGRQPIDLRDSTMAWTGNRRGLRGQSLYLCSFPMRPAIYQVRTYIVNLKGSIGIPGGIKSTHRGGVGAHVPRLHTPMDSKVARPEGIVRILGASNGRVIPCYPRAK